MNIYLVNLSPDRANHLQLTYSYRGLAKELRGEEYCKSFLKHYTLYSYKGKPLKKRNL